jgi:bifunctional UDP-N-acetylglucosamine pyrophosphorylase/glucosamine-1-phosphate N-acetyltransferase
MSEDISALILAAGKGVRMKSALPKVLHPILGRPMVRYVVDAVRAAGARAVSVVVGFGKDKLIPALGGLDLSFVSQDEQLGTGHAVQCYARPSTTPPDHLLVVCGDTPLISQSTLQTMVCTHLEQKHAITMLTLTLTDPAGYGRIIRDEAGRVTCIREAKDCSASEKTIREINLAVYLFQGKPLFERLFKLTNTNTQKEYYLTDLIEMFARDGLSVHAIAEKDESSTLGINSRADLALVSTIMKNRLLAHHMAAGVTIVDPNQTLIEPDITIGPDTTIWPGTVITGKTVIGGNCEIGPQTTIHSSTLGDFVQAPSSYLENVSVPDGSTLEPFSRQILNVL